MGRLGNRAITLRHRSDPADVSSSLVALGVIRRWCPGLGFFPSAERIDQNPRGLSMGETPRSDERQQSLPSASSEPSGDLQNRVESARSEHEAARELPRLLWVSTELRTGGAERCMTQLALDFHQRGWPSRVVSLAPLPDRRTELVDRLREAGVPTESLDAKQLWQFPLVARRLARQLREFRPTHTLSFLFHANVTLWRARRMAGSADRWIANVRVADPRRWRTWLERQAFRQASHVVAVSEDVARHYRACGVTPEKLREIPNGVDLQRFDSVGTGDVLDAGTTEATADVAVVGRLHPQKGIEPLLRAWAQASEAARRLRLAVVGEGPSRESLERLAVELGLDDRIEWVGWRSRPWDVLKRVPVVLLPSRFEGMANVMLEAMAARKVVFATEVQGVAEVLGNAGGNAPPNEPIGDSTPGTRWQVVPPDNLVEMWERATQVVADQQLAMRLAAANRGRIESDYRWEQCRERFAALLLPRD